MRKYEIVCVGRERMARHPKIKQCFYTKVCPYCQSEIAIKAVRCPHCTTKLEGFPEIND